MSSLARRTLRATAAVAGIAAAGVGIAAPAFAAPAAPERPSTDEAVPAPDTRSTPNVLGSAPKTTEVPDLPQLFTVENTGVYTADRGLPQLPTTRHLPAPDLPTPHDAIEMDDTQQTRGTDVQFRTAAPQRDGAMQQLDAASMFDAVPGQVLGATENNDVRY